MQALTKSSFIDAFTHSTRKDQISYEALAAIFEYLEGYSNDTCENVDQELTFTTLLDDQGKHDSYSVNGMVTLEGEVVSIGYYTTDLNKAFDELIYWMHAVESESNKAAVKVTFKAI